MTKLTQKILFSAAAVLFSLAMTTHEASATTHHHKHHAKKHHMYSAQTITRIAQEHLQNLGYYSGKIDGVMGPQTRAAIKKFQHEHALKADGVLGSRTNRALDLADHTTPRVIGSQSFQTHDVVTPGGNDQPLNPDYATGLSGGSKTISSRFGRVDVNETGSGSSKRYTVNLNGQPLLVADGQASVIGVSQTYDLGNEDAVVFTTFSPNDSGCTYKNHVLALSNSGTKILDIENCTRAYQARVNNGSLYVTFPEHDDNRAFGATWRLEGMTLERL